MQQVLDYGRDPGVDAVELTVHRFNEGTARFFASLGLKVVSARMPTLASAVRGLQTTAERP